MIESCPYAPPTKENVCSTEGLLYFVWEREAIRSARENEFPPPWTNDPVLAKYKFTNIRRKDDRVTKWIINNIIIPYENDEYLWFTLLIARLINWPPTLKALLEANVIPCTPNAFNAEKFSKTVESCKQKQAKVYSGAYMVYPTKMDPGGNKSQAIAKHIIGSVVQHSSYINGVLWGEEAVIETFVDVLSECFGISTFMAGQVAADLTYSKKHLGTASDLLSYAPIGPGSTRGLNYLLGRSPYSSWVQEEFNAALIEIDRKIYEELDITDMTLHDVQNVMCEFSKYCRVVLKEGIPKTLFKSETEF